MPTHLFAATAAAALAAASAPAPAPAEADPYHPAKPNQIAAARAIMDIFRAGHCHYAMLIAEMQSGKTGTFQTLIKMALATGLVKRVYILCGSSERLLRNQAGTDTKDYNLGADVTVVFRQDFFVRNSSANPLKTHMVTDDALLIVDESHLDSKGDQMMARFLHKHHLSLRGTLPVMLERKTYICSVSATPYAELAKLHKGASLPKEKVVLEPGTGYFGLRNYEAAGKLRPTFDIAAEPDRFKALLTAPATPKWILFRGQGKAADRARALAEEAGLEVVHYNWERKDIAITRREDPSKPCLDNAPTRTTMVILKGCLRVGKVVPKAHVAFVWENAKNGKTDTIVQALPGRMCGYFAPGADKPDIYVPERLLTRVKSVVRRSHLPVPLPAGGLLRPMDLDPRGGVSRLDRHNAAARGAAMGPDGAHTTGGSGAACADDRNERPVSQCPPIYLRKGGASEDDWSDIEDGALSPLRALIAWARAEKKDVVKTLQHLGGATRHSVITALLTGLKEHLRTNELPACLTPAQKQEIRRYCGLTSTCTDAGVVPLEADMKGIALRHLTREHDGTHRDYFVKVKAAAEAGEPCRDKIPDSPFVTFHIDHATRHIYAVFHTYAMSALPGIDMKSLFGDVGDDLVFDDRVEEAAGAASRADTVGGATLTRIPRCAVGHPPTLRNHLDWLLARQHQYPDSISPYVSCFPLQRAAYNFVDRTHNDLETLLRELGTTHGVRFTVTYKDAVRSDNFGVESIRWTVL